MTIEDWLDEKIGEKWRKVMDQVAHFLWAFVALIPVLVIESHVIGGAFSAVLFALPRELVDQWPVRHWKDTALDLVFFALGGAAIGYLFKVI